MHRNPQKKTSMNSLAKDFAVDLGPSGPAPASVFGKAKKQTLI
jgi:hypothetical protein